MRIFFYLGTARFAERNASDFHGLLPRRDEAIRLKSGLYLIKEVVWVADCDDHHVTIQLLRVTDSDKGENK
jgi:hypothetical protein